jgi:thymidine kinase
MVCGNTAQYSYRKNNTSKEQVLVGTEDVYEARCRKCFHA